MSLAVKKHLAKGDRPIAIIEGGDLDGEFLVVYEKPGTEAIIIPPESTFL